MLGAGECQLNLINRLKKEGHCVHISDYYKNSPGKEGNTFNYLVSTYDLDENLKIAKAIEADAVMTAGTDQPVKTIGYISEKLGIERFLSYEQSLDMTNKIRMKEKFTRCDIPTVEYQLIDLSIQEDEVNILYPAVIKPADSQGQRGIFIVHSFDQLKENLPTTFNFTQEKKVLLEQYYPSDEITVTGWVEDGKTHILSMSDRETFQEGKHIGICKGHRYPSKYFYTHQSEIIDLTERIVDQFNIQNGPIYFQMLLGEEGLKVNEIAARLGGAYEDEYIPMVTGVDLLGLLIDRSLNDNSKVYFEKVHYLDIHQYIYVALLFSTQGKVKRLTPMTSLIGKRGVISGKLFIREGEVLPPVINATQRIGYAIISGESNEDLNTNIDCFYKKMMIEMED